VTIETNRPSPSASSSSSASSRSADSDRLLHIYLNDHRAGAAAGLARAKRFAAANATSFLAEDAAAVCRAIEDDVGTLEEIAHRLGCRPSRGKMFLARAAEFVGRLKTNGRLRGYSPLSRLVEVEVLSAGLLTKESLWRTLGVIQQGRPELAGIDFGELQRRAVEQRAQLEAHREATVTDALVP
jgi:hypothetical protein